MEDFVGQINQPTNQLKKFFVDRRGV